MSAHRTDLDKEASRHRGPLRGMFAVVLFALVLLLGLGIWAFSRGGDPEGAETQVQGTTGAEQATDAAAGPSANDVAGDDQAGAGGAEADPAAVTVAPETVTSPQTGAGVSADTDPGESMNAEPANEGAGQGD